MLENAFAFANQKGGVGKTTSCINLACALALQKKRVLLLDLDPQGNATMGSGVDKSTLTCSVNELLLGEATAKQAIIKNTPAGYDVIGSNGDSTAAEVTLTKKSASPQTLSNALKPIQSDYDYILMDCPPSLNMLTLNGLVMARRVFIAMQCEYFALEGLSALVSTIEQVKSAINPQLEIGGIIRTMFDNRNRLCLEVSDQLMAHFGSKVFQTVIPRNVRLAEAPSHGLPVMLYDRQSRGAAAYAALASEIVKRFSATSTAVTKKHSSPSAGTKLVEQETTEVTS